METRNCSLVRSSVGGNFLLVYTYSIVPNYISLCSYSSVSLLIYVSTCFFGAERGTNPTRQLLYVGINTGVILSS